MTLRGSDVCVILLPASVQQILKKRASGAESDLLRYALTNRTSRFRRQARAHGYTL